MLTPIGGLNYFCWWFKVILWLFSFETYKGGVHIMGEICPRSDPDIAHMRYYLGPLKLKSSIDLHYEDIQIWNFGVIFYKRKAFRLGKHSHRITLKCKYESWQIIIKLSAITCGLGDWSLFMAEGDGVKSRRGAVEKFVRFREWALKKISEAQSGQRKTFS